MESENTSRDIKAQSAEHALRLPDEIIEEILWRLPVKSLLKFRCVSKSWRYLIGSDRFIKTHLENSTRITNFDHQGIILNPTRSYDRLKQCSLRSLLNEPLTDPFTFNDSTNFQCVYSIRLVGCCNGLICVLLDRKTFILWNPSTRVTKKLPDADPRMMGKQFTKYGFGYDESSGDYKVFGIISVFCTIGEFRAIGKVYSLKSNSWKTRTDKDVSPFDEAGKFVSGNLHWQRGYGNEREIVSFDLKSEVYGMVQQPSYSEGGSFHPSLRVLGGCLCVLCDYQELHIDVWVMKQYGAKESWEKLATLPYLQNPFNFKGGYLTPFCIGTNGEILLANGPKFMIYCPNDNVFPYHRILDIDSLYEADIYTESLVSLVSDGEQEDNLQNQL